MKIANFAKNQNLISLPLNLKKFLIGSTLGWIFIGLAFAQGASETAPQAPTPTATPPGGTASFLMQLPIFLGIFAIMYFVLIRPQKEQQKKHAEYLAKLTRGDEVVTTGGIIGKIVGLTDRVVSLEVSPGTEIKILRSQIQTSARDGLVPGNQTTAKN